MKARSFHPWHRRILLVVGVALVGLAGMYWIRSHYRVDRWRVTAGRATYEIRSANGSLEVGNHYLWDEWEQAKQHAMALKRGQLGDRYEQFMEVVARGSTDHPPSKEEWQEAGK